MSHSSLFLAGCLKEKSQSLTVNIHLVQLVCNSISLQPNTVTKLNTDHLVKGLLKVLEDTANSLQLLDVSYYEYYNSTMYIVIIWSCRGSQI